jgi:hypothetical protein
MNKFVVCISKKAIQQKIHNLNTVVYVRRILERTKRGLQYRILYFIIILMNNKSSNL